MRQKELRIALVCYGGVSLAVYMHGVTKEIWHLARASRAFHSHDATPLAGSTEGVDTVYRELLEYIEDEKALRLRFLPDILSGASAGGINAVFLAQAVYSGHSLEPLTDLWLKKADVDELVDPEAQPMWRYAKFWAQPIANWLLKRPGNAVSESVSPETRREVRRKVSQLVRGRWFEPPFSGIGFSNMLYEAFMAMEAAESGPSLLPPRHPVDLFVTTTDFRGHLEYLRLNSPPVVEETEHRMPVSFHARAQNKPGSSLADPLELTFAARATASFPGAFPPLQVAEIDRLAKENDAEWSNREIFLARIMPSHLRDKNEMSVSLIDGSVLNNKPFGGAMEALKGRPAQREVDRRFVYIDPRPDRTGSLKEGDDRPVGFFSAIFGSLSIIPREQPIRDNLEALERQSRDAERLRRIVMGLRPDVESAVEKLFGRTFFLDSPTPKRLKNWRAKSQQSAAREAGYAFQPYAQTKFAAIIERLASLILEAAPKLALPDTTPIEAVLRAELAKRELDVLSDPAGGASEAAVAFFRIHDIGYRVRRLRLLARRLARDWEIDPEIDDEALDLAREAIYNILGHYFRHDGVDALGSEFPELAARIFEDPGAVIDYFAANRLRAEVDEEAETLFADALEAMPKNLRRRMLLTYLGFPFYDVATLALLRGEGGLSEYDAIKVDRISPDDARSIREGGTRATLRGTEFYNFGAFFSRAYRENDYLWGRLHGAERMIDLICSTVDGGIDDSTCREFKRRAFLAIIDEEERIGRCREVSLDLLRAEVEERLGPAS